MHGQSLVNTPGVAIEAVCDIKPARAKKAANRYNCKPYLNYKKMLDTEELGPCRDYDKIFEILKQANYRGFFNVEYKGKEDELEYVPISIDMIKKYAVKYGI